MERIAFVIGALLICSTAADDCDPLTSTWCSTTETGDLTKPIDNENSSDKCFVTGQDLIETRVPQFCMFDKESTIQKRCCNPV